MSRPVTSSPIGGQPIPPQPPGTERPREIAPVRKSTERYFQKLKSRVDERSSSVNPRAARNLPYEKFKNTATKTIAVESPETAAVRALMEGNIGKS